MSTQRIYLDNAATTPLDGRVLAAMHPWFERSWGNPSSLHRDGREAKVAVDKARGQVASLIGAEPGDVYFTGGGTEANNLALRGVLGNFSSEPLHLITTGIEHPSVLEVCRRLSPHAVEVTYLPVDSDGIIDPEQLEDAITDRTCLISVMAANNVVGTLQPIADCGRIAAGHQIPFHVDATQAVGKVAINVKAIHADMLSFSGHKLHGPKGVGVLYVRRGTLLYPLIHGGGQEGGLRSGTENVPGIVGLGEACRICQEELTDAAVRLVQLRDRLIDRLIEEAPGAYLLGDRYRRLPGFAAFGFDGLEGEAIRLLLALDDLGISVSTGSACSSRHASDPSHVLLAMGFDPVRARGSLRVSLGRFNNVAEIDCFVDALTNLVQQRTPLAGRR
jgi:cysteine desulfurase